MPGFPNLFMLMGPHSPIGNQSMVPVAEDLKVMNFMWDCGAASILEAKKYRYNFRTQANATPEMLAVLVYLQSTPVLSWMLP